MQGHGCHLPKTTSYRPAAESCWRPVFRCCTRVCDSALQQRQQTKRKKSKKTTNKRDKKEQSKHGMTDIHFYTHHVYSRYSKQTRRRRSRRTLHCPMSTPAQCCSTSQHLPAPPAVDQRGHLDVAYTRPPPQSKTDTTDRQQQLLASVTKKQTHMAVLVR